MIMNMPLQQVMWKGTWAHLQDPGADLTVLRGPGHVVSTPAGDQRADALAKIGALITDPSVDTADRVHWKKRAPHSPGRMAHSRRGGAGAESKGSGSGVSKFESIYSSNPQQQGMGKLTTCVPPSPEQGVQICAAEC